MTTTETIDNSADVIDSRDVIARIEVLEGEREALTDAREAARVALVAADDREAMAAMEDAMQAVIDWDTDYMGELAALIELAKEASDYAADWQYGETLIRDSYFQTYAQELAEDIAGKAISHAQWPLNCIDWAQAARELRQDYTSVEFGGVTYWIR